MGEAATNQYWCPRALPQGKNQCMLPAAPRTLPHSNTGQEEGKMDYPTSIQTDGTCQSAVHLPPNSYLQPTVQQPCSSQQSPCGSPQLGTQGRAVPAPSGYWIHASLIRGWSWDPTVPKQWNTQATWEVSAEESSAAHVVLILFLFFNVDILFVYGCYWELRYNRFWSQIPLQPAQHHFDTSGQGACSAPPRHALNLNTRTSAHWSLPMFLPHNYHQTNSLQHMLLANKESLLTAPSSPELVQLHWFGHSSGPCKKSYLWPNLQAFSPVFPLIKLYCSSFIQSKNQ